MIRSGIGYDIHRFVEGLKLILGGVEIEHARGLEGHSDADVLSHAIADALLGAIGSGDIGQLFPNTDESIRGISSMEILKRVAKICRAAEMADARVSDLFRRCDPTFVLHPGEPTDHGADRSHAHPIPPRERAVVSVRSAFAA